MQLLCDFSLSFGRARNTIQKDPQIYPHIFSASKWYCGRARVASCAVVAAIYSWLIIALNVKFLWIKEKIEIDSKRHDLDIKHQEAFSLGILSINATQQLKRA